MLQVIKPKEVLTISFEDAINLREGLIKFLDQARKSPGEYDGVTIGIYDNGTILAGLRSSGEK